MAENGNGAGASRVVLYTHTDFDGVASAVLISSVEDVAWIEFAEPGQIQRGEVDVRKGSIITDLPFHPNCALWFDHHASSQHAKKFEGRYDPKAPSAARVVLDYYENPYLNDKFGALVEATDKIDQANFTREDVEKPAGYYLLSMSLDGADTASEAMAFRRRLIELLRKKPLEEIFKDAQVAAFIDKKLSGMKKAEALLPTYSLERGHVAIVDFRNAPSWLKDSASRWWAYTAYPDCVASIRVRNSREAGTVDISVGENIFNRKLTVDLGALLKRFGGGGHRMAAGCKVNADAADAAIDEILAELNA